MIGTSVATVKLNKATFAVCGVHRILLCMQIKLNASHTAEKQGTR